MANASPSVSPRPGAVVQLDPFVRRLTAPNPSIMTGPGTNTYLVGDDTIAVVDPGPDLEDHLARIEAAARGRIRHVLVTHTHSDHAPGAVPLAARTKAQLCGYDARDGFVPDLELRGGDTVDLGPVALTAIHTPGHASNHLCYLVATKTTDGSPANRTLLLSGDHVMGGSTVVIAPPDGDMARYMSSLESLLALDPPIDAIAPGHGAVLEDPGAAIRALLDHRRARERTVLAALNERRAATIDELVAAVYTDVDPGRHKIARLTLWAHLLKLRDEERASCEQPEDIDSLWVAANR